MHLLKTKNYKLKTSQGFSLPEILVATSVFVVIALAMTTLQRDIFTLSGTTRDSLNAQQDLRTAMKKLTAELRAAQTSDTGSYPIEAASATSLTFYSDIDSDGSRERLRYFLQGETLRKGVLASSGLPAAYVSANERLTDVVNNVLATSTPIFSYYTAGFTPDLAPLPFPVYVSLIRLVKVFVSVEADPSRAPNMISAITQVSLRNLRD